MSVPNKADVSTLDNPAWRNVSGNCQRVYIIDIRQGSIGEMPLFLICQVWIDLWSDVFDAVWYKYSYAIL
jgi:hypothetical protein